MVIHVLVLRDLIIYICFSLSFSMHLFLLSLLPLWANSMEIDTLPVVVQIANDVSSLVTNKSDWKKIYEYSKKGSTELDFQIHTSRTSLIGSVLNTMFWYFFPPTFDVAITNMNRTEIFFQQEFHQYDPNLNIVVNGPFILLVRNLNTIFPLSIWLVGQVVAESDIFDLRKKRAQCNFPVYSQGTCGACYADVVAGTGSDFLCNKTLSPQPIVSCSRLGGCNGGSPYLAAQWAQQHGLDEEALFPYKSNTCTPSQDLQKDGCVTCSPQYESGRFRFKPVVIPPYSEESMKRHISEGGSIMVIFDAHANFQEFFKAHPYGLYQTTDNTPSLGNHAVRLVGFGIEGTDKFWVAINSWGSNWGDQGSFRFKRGENLCKIEQYPVGLQQIDHVEAGLAENGPSESMVVGGWKDQEKNDPYWKKFTDKYVPNTIVLKISTQFSHGYTVKLETDQGVKYVHINPDGLENADAQSTQPEHNVFVIVS